MRQTLALVFVALSPLWLFAQAGMVPKVLFDPALPDAARQVTTQNSTEQASSAIADDGIAVQFKAGPAAYPGITIKPAGGSPWNLGLYGHVEARVTNTGSAQGEPQPARGQR